MSRNGTWPQTGEVDNGRTCKRHLSDLTWLFLILKLFIGTELLSVFVDPVSVVGNIGVDTWVVGVCTSVSPWGGTNTFTLSHDWTTGVTLACVFTSDSEFTSTEHTLICSVAPFFRIVVNYLEGWIRCMRFWRYILKLGRKECRHSGVQLGSLIQWPKCYPIHRHGWRHFRTSIHLLCELGVLLEQHIRSRSSWKRIQEQQYRWRCCCCCSLDVFGIWSNQLFVELIHFAWCCEHRQQHWQLMVSNNNELQSYHGWLRQQYHHRSEMIFGEKEYVAQNLGQQRCHQWRSHFAMQKQMQYQPITT